MLKLRQLLMTVGMLMVSLAGFADKNEVLGNDNASHTTYAGTIESIEVVTNSTKYSGFWVDGDAFEIKVKYSQEPASTDAVYLEMKNDLAQPVLQKGYLFTSSTATERTYSMTSPDPSPWQPTKGNTYTITFYKTRTGDDSNYQYSDPMKSCTITYGIESSVSANVSAEAKWGTFVAPFDVDFPASQVKVFTNNGIKTEQGKATLNIALAAETDGYYHVPAKTPVLLYSSAGYNNTFTNIHAQPNDLVYAGCLVGVLASGYNIPASDATKKNYVLQKQGTNVGFYVVQSEKAATQYRAYVSTSTAAPANIRLPQIDEPSAINGLPDAAEKEVVAIYSMSGVKLPTLQRGTNIVKYSDGSTAKIVR